MNCSSFYRFGVTLVFVVGLVGLCKPTQAAAFLSGQSMILEGAGPTVNDLFYTRGPFIVGPGPEVTFSMSGFADFTLDVSDTSATFTGDNAARSIS